MDIKLPSQAAHLVGKVREEELLVVALLHHIRKMYNKHEWFSLYRYDVNTILGEVHASPNPFYCIRNLKSVIQGKNIIDYKLDLRLKRWTGEEFTYQIQDFRNLIVWSIILDHRTYAETSRNKPSNKVYWTNASADKRYLVSAIKSQYHKYDSEQLD